MSIGHCGFTGMGLPMNVPLPPVKNRPTPPAESRPLQRLAAVRRQQGVSRRTVARRLNIDIEQVQEQERETTDVPLSVLYAWQKVLEVPLAELLTEAGEGLDTPILERSQLLRLMKTVRAICEQARQESIRRMAQTMAAQLIEIMPELANVGAWHTVGKRRRLNELGIAAQRRFADEVFIDNDE
ncbi:MAG: helix-turn-helix transcriptional regulator [Thermoguttaceae bacterium]